MERARSVKRAKRPRRGKARFVLVKPKVVEIPKVKEGLPQLCALCGRWTRPGDFCWGCRKWICMGCSRNMAVSHGHLPQEHLIERDDDDFPEDD